MKYARIVNGAALDVRTESPEGCFTPNIVAEFVEVPDEVETGWTLNGGVWSAPVIPEPAPAPTPVEVMPKLSPIEFKLCFTAAERIALKTLRATDSIVDDWMTILDDPRLTEVNLNLASTQAAVDYLASVGVINETRAGQIKRGEMQ
jgi:hypothetical protein